MKFIIFIFKLVSIVGFLASDSALFWDANKYLYVDRTFLFELRRDIYVVIFAGTDAVFHEISILKKRIFVQQALWKFKTKELK